MDLCEFPMTAQAHCRHKCIDQRWRRLQSHGQQRAHQHPCHPDSSVKMNSKQRRSIIPLLLLSFSGIIIASCGFEAAEHQLHEWSSLNARTVPDRATDQKGVPVPSMTASLTVGRLGTMLMQDNNFLDQLAHFDRERIPERVVHAKGGGAFGYFETTHDISRWTKARVFDRIGKRTPLAVRFSTVSFESGSADTLRDPRGFAVKFYTEDGNWDLVGNNLENFPIRDPILFPSLIHSRKRNPQTHLFDQNSFWDFNSLRPETTFHTLLLFSDRGIPDGFRHMHGFGAHTFKFVNALGQPVYCKFHWRSEQGVKSFDPATAERVAGSDPDYNLRDLYNAIARKEFPSWTLSVQIMTYEQARSVRFNPFDLTKIWFIEDFPLYPVGRMVLNRNPADYFAEVEQAIFHPGNFVPGIEASPDPMLQGRMFSYSDTQRYRLGTNFLQIPVNQPLPGVKIATYMRDGSMSVDGNGFGGPNYFPNSYGGPVPDPNAQQSNFTLVGDVARFDTGGDDNYLQADRFWRTEFAQDEKERIAQNLASVLKNVDDVIRNRVLTNMFDPVNPEVGRMVRYALNRAIISKRETVASFKGKQ